MEKHYGDKNITTHRKERLKLSNGPYQDKVETVVASVRTARMRIPAVGAEHQLFASCLAVKKLVEKPEQSA